MITACCADPCCCMLSCVCPICASYSLRKRALKGDMSKYRCCQGYSGCGCCKCHDCGEDNCPMCCLMCEICCCFDMSVLSTRWMLQDEYYLQNSCCDNCLIAYVAFMRCLACILRCVPGVPDGVEEIVDIISNCLYCSVCACMQTQAKVEMDKREQSGGMGMTTVTTTTVVTTQPALASTGDQAVTKQPIA